MSTAFTPFGPCATLVANGTAQAIELPPGDQGQPTILYICSNDPTYSVAVNTNFGEEAVDAVLPTSGTSFDGVGTVIVAQGTAIIKLDSAYQTQSLWVSAISDGTARIFITPGTL